MGRSRLLYRVRGVIVEAGSSREDINIINDFSLTSSRSSAVYDTRYPLKGGDGLTAPGSIRAIGESSSTPSRGYPVSGADSKSQEPWVVGGGGCRGVGWC